MKKVLVTGGAGFIGSHVTQLLCEQGYKVVVIDDLSFGFKKFIDPRAQFIKGSIGNQKLIEKALERVEAVIHLAALSIIKFSYQRPLEYFENNVLNGVILLETMRKKGVKKIINSSTAAVYGEPKRIPVKEDDPKIPHTIYGASKLAFEKTLIAYYHSYGTESVSLRYFNAYGPRDEQQPATRAVPIWIKAILKDKPVPLYWQGKQRRDYVYVKDIAQAHLDVLRLSGLHFYNIGSGKGVLMTEIIKTLEKVSGKKAQIVDRGQRKGDPQKLVADITKIKKEVGWQPQTPLLQGLKETFKYYEPIH